MADSVNFFDHSDISMADKLLKVDGIFRNKAVGDISKEMEYFSRTIKIARTFE